jgi:uncharacterized protein YjbI with pentapeptide repeats
VVIVWRRRDRRLRRWLREVADVAGADLHQARLVAMDLRNKNFRGANLRFDAGTWHGASS